MIKKPAWITDSLAFKEAVVRVEASLKQFDGMQFSPDPPAWLQEPPSTVATPSRMTAALESILRDLEREGLDLESVSVLRIGYKRVIDRAASDAMSRLQKNCSCR